LGRGREEKGEGADQAGCIYLLGRDRGITGLAKMRGRGEGELGSSGGKEGEGGWAFGPESGRESVFVFLLFFSLISKPFQIHFKIYLKYFDFAQNHTFKKTCAPI